MAITTQYLLENSQIFREQRNRNEPPDGLALIGESANLDAIAAALFTYIDVAMAALQDISMVTCVAHLAPETASRRTRFYALESARMLAFVVVLQFCKDLIESCASLIRGNVRWRISFHDFFCSLFDPVDVSCLTPAILPFNAADIAEFCATNASGPVS